MGRLATVVTVVRALLTAVAVVVVLATTACGSGKPKVIGRVQLNVTSPKDGEVVREDTVTVRGQVEPRAAVVLVEGRKAQRTGAGFEASVDLTDGTTVIDIVAQAPRRNPAVVALRVRRPVTVVIPDLKDAPPSEADSRLADLGLKPETKNSGGILDELFGGRLRVCGTDPESGSTVDVGSVVVVRIGRSC